MTTLITLLALAALVLGLVALVSFARHDRLAGPTYGFTPRDELGPLAFRRRPV